MKKYLLILITAISFAQAPSRFSNVQITGNTVDNTAQWVNVQTDSGIIKKILKSSLVPQQFTNIVYVNATSPTGATIFDLNNPPVTNDNLLKATATNLYIGTDGSTWNFNTVSGNYATYTVPKSSNFNLVGTSIDAGNDKNNPIERNSSIKVPSVKINNSEIKYNPTSSFPANYKTPSDAIEIKGTMNQDINFINQGTGMTTIQGGWGLGFKPSIAPVSGPDFGTNMGGMSYRPPTESMTKNFLIFRFGQYVFEDDTASWKMIITPTGVNVGGGATDVGGAVPKSMFEVSGNATIGSDYARASTAPTNGLLVQGRVGIGTGGQTVSAPLVVKSGAAGLEVDTDANTVKMLSYDRTLGAFKDIKFRGSTFTFSPSDVDKVTIDNAGKTTVPALNISGQTASTIASFDASKNVVSLPTASYPSLTEIATVKGASSNLQDQINTKATDSNVLHLTGDETFTGVKTSTNVGTSLTNGFSLINNGSSSLSCSIALSNNGTGTGQNISNTGTGAGININNASTGFGLKIANNSTNIGAYINNQAGGSGLLVDNYGVNAGIRIENYSTGIGLKIRGSSNGNNIYSSQDVLGTGFNYVGVNSGTNTFTVDKFGTITANKLNLQTASDSAVGNATLVAGTKTITTNVATTSSIIMLTKKTNGGTIGTTTYTTSNGSFTITSSAGADTSTYSYLIIN